MKQIELVLDVMVNVYQLCLKVIDQDHEKKWVPLPKENFQQQQNPISLLQFNINQRFYFVNGLPSIGDGFS
jgi:hypothetical protein